MLRGANSDTQWYWPAEVGEMDASSAIDAYTHVMPKPHTIKPQKSKAGPPSMRTNVKSLFGRGKMKHDHQREK